MKYILFLIVSACFCLGLISCGGNDAAMNNGSDTGVIKRYDDNIMGDIERGVDNITDGTIFDANGDHSNVDDYKLNGDYSGDGEAYNYNNGADMSYNPTTSSYNGME